MSSDIAEVHQRQYIRAMERALRILGFDPARIEVYADGTLSAECIAKLTALRPAPAPGPASGAA